MTQTMPTETLRADADPTHADTLPLQIGNVLGSMDVEVQVGAAMSAGAVTSSIAQQMNLPADVAYGLRSDSDSRYLDESLPIGEQVRPDAHLTVIPKAHLGANEDTRCS